MIMNMLKIIFCHSVSHLINWRLIFPDRRSNLSRISGLPTLCNFSWSRQLISTNLSEVEITVARWLFVNKTKINQSRNLETTEYGVEMKNKVLIEKIRITVEKKMLLSQCSISRKYCSCIFSKLLRIMRFTVHFFFSLQTLRILLNCRVVNFLQLVGKWQ